MENLKSSKSKNEDCNLLEARMIEMENKFQKLKEAK
jgi:hypothetical protein